MYRIHILDFGQDDTAPEDDPTLFKLDTDDRGLVAEILAKAAQSWAASPNGDSPLRPASTSQPADPPRRRGRPPGSANKPKTEPSADVPVGTEHASAPGIDAPPVNPFA